MLSSSYTGPVFPNSQIVHQMPYGHMIAAGQPQPTIQIQHHPADLKVIDQHISTNTIKTNLFRILMHKH